MTDYESLLTYRRAVADLYAEVRRAGSDSRDTWLQFRDTRDDLFATHSQSALTEEQRAGFTSLSYFEYDPAYHFAVEIDTDVEPEVFTVELNDDGLFRYKRFGRINFTTDTQPATLSLFWILGYGGGLFLPFRDATNRDETYGGGRYLLDTIKHADLGHAGDKLIVDFNYAYNPSCAYNHQWHCPLAPAENWLPMPIRAGEKAFDG